MLREILWLKLRSRSTPELLGITVRRFVEDVGGIWTKVGQVLGMHHDIFGEPFSSELSKLQDRAPGFPFATVERILAEDLSAPAAEVFDRFDEWPVAAASIGQVHQAHLRRENVTVAVKVQRPGIARTFSRDLGVLALLFRLLHGLRLIDYEKWRDMLNELRIVLRDELDYHVEAASIRRLRKNLRRHHIYAPKVFRRYCGDRVLVMEYIDGVFMSEFIEVAVSDPPRLRAWCAENGIRPRKVGSHLFYAQFTQIYEDNLFHVDLHPGNIVLLRDNHVAFIDFGSRGSLDETFRFRYNLLFDAIVNGNYAKAADFFLVLAPQLPPIDLEEVKKEIIRRLQQWELRTEITELPFQTRSFTALIRELTDVLIQYRIRANWQYLRVDRSLLTLDSSLAHLIPSRNVYKMMRRYERAATYRSAARALRPARAAHQAARWFVLTARTADLVPETIDFGAEELRKQAATFQVAAGKGSDAMRTILCLAAAGSAVALVLLVLIFCHQVGWLDLGPHLRGTPVYGWFARFLAVRSLRWEGKLAWTVVLAFGSGCVVSLLRIRKRLAQPDFLLPRQTRVF